jgi:hypothetical protein
MRNPAKGSNSQARRICHGKDLGAPVFAGVADLVGRKRKKLVTGVTASVA